MRLDPETLDGAPETGARVLALARLAEAEEALARLADPKDREGPRQLPDALLRLVAMLRALSPALGGAVPSALQGEVEAAARAAAPSREPEAFAAWLASARGDLPAPYRGSLDWLSDRVERRCRRAREELAAEALPKARRALFRLGSALARRGSARAAGGATFAAVLAAAVRAQTRALREAVLEAAGPADVAGLEPVRGAARRLRDLLDPLRLEEASAAASAVEALRAPLEAFLSALAAAEAFEGALLEARAEEARRGEAIPGLRPGLLALLRLAEQRADAARRELTEPIRARATPVTDASYAAAAALLGADEEGGADASEEPAALPERRFLVTAIPPEGQGGGFETLEQGWLPGDGHESVGVARSPLGEQWYRARAGARGRPARAQAIGRADFESLWPLSEGRRISKRRHLAPGAPGWHFDEYLDRPLVLAVAEEGNADAPPAWMEPVLVRDVSSERGYLDEALARRTARRTG